MLEWAIVSRLVAAFAAALLSACWAASCSVQEGRPPLQEPAAGSGGASPDGGAGQAGAAGGVIVGDGGFDPDSACGYRLINARQEPVRLYVVLDRSGSMSDSAGNLSKYTTTRSALVKLVEQIGWRSQIGAALFPGNSGSCSAGVEVFPPSPGDPRSFLEEGSQGPKTKQFAQAIASTPQGGTPTGKTLQKLIPRLKNLGPHTYVLLATDGGPNCNEDVTCQPSECMPNIEQFPGCDAATNCCDPSVGQQFSWVNCLDTDATLSAVLALREAGVKTLVVGIPGSAQYGTLLDLLAVAGGAPREGATRYYRVDDLATLEELFLQIGTQVTVSCDISLDEPPEDPDAVNIFVDGALLLNDPKDGWEQTGPTTLTLRGKSCSDVTSGAIDKIQVVVGCPTQVKLPVGPVTGGRGQDPGGELFFSQLDRDLADPAADPVREAHADLTLRQLLQAHADQQHQIVERSPRRVEPSLDGLQAPGVSPGGPHHQQPQPPVEPLVAGGQRQRGQLRGPLVLPSIQQDQHPHRLVDAQLPRAQVGPLHPLERHVRGERVSLRGRQVSVPQPQQASNTHQRTGGHEFILTTKHRFPEALARGADAAHVAPGEGRQQGPGEEGGDVARAKGPEKRVGTEEPQGEQGPAEPAPGLPPGDREPRVLEFFPGGGQRHGDHGNPPRPGMLARGKTASPEVLDGEGGKSPAGMAEEGVGAGTPEAWIIRQSASVNSAVEAVPPRSRVRIWREA